MRFVKFLVVYLSVSSIVLTIRFTVPAQQQWQFIAIIELLIALVAFQALNYFDKK